MRIFMFRFGDRSTLSCSLPTAIHASMRSLSGRPRTLSIAKAMSSSLSWMLPWQGRSQSPFRLQSGIRTRPTRMRRPIRSLWNQHV